MKGVFDCSKNEFVKRELTEEEIAELERQKQEPVVEPQPTKEELLQERIKALEQSNAEMMALVSSLTMPNV